MLKTFQNRTTIEALTPWTTNDHEELASLLPEIIVKKKKKKQKRQNIENEPPYYPSQSNAKQQIDFKNNCTSAKQGLFLPAATHQQKVSPIQDKKQNQLNFIKKSKKLKFKTELKNRIILCPNPLTSERQYVHSSNYPPTLDQSNSKINFQDQFLFKGIMNMENSKTENKKSQDVHSLYLIEKLKAISSTHEPLKNKDYKSKSKPTLQSPFLDYLSQNKGIRPHEKRILSQREPRQSSYKTQGSDFDAKYQLNFLKKTTNKNVYLTHRKQTHNFSLLNNEQSKILSPVKQNFNIEWTFALKTRTVLKCKEAKSMEMKNPHRNSNLLKPSKELDNKLFHDQNLESKFSVIELQAKPSNKQTNSMPLQPINYQLTQMQSAELPAKKSKVSFMIQKSQFSVKTCIKNKNKSPQKEIPFDEQISLKMEHEMKKNLRKLRGYLVKKTRDHCLEKGHLNENELILYENNRNHFGTE